MQQTFQNSEYAVRSLIYHNSKAVSERDGYFVHPHSERLENEVICIEECEDILSLLGRNHDHQGNLMLTEEKN